MSHYGGSSGKGRPADEYSSDGSGDSDSWVEWFTKLRGNEFFCQVDEDFLTDDFNLYGLPAVVPYYDYALDLIQDYEPLEEVNLTSTQEELVESAAEMLYGLIHARYILTTRGLAAMSEKYARCDFGRCPRVNCNGQAVLPVGRSDRPREFSVSVYCPLCQDIYNPKSTRSSSIDGAYFGTTFPHLFFLSRPRVIPTAPKKEYVPRVFGFRIHKSSKYFTKRLENGQADEKSKQTRA